MLGPTPLHRLPFAPVWMCNVAQQEEFEFEDEETAQDDETLMVDVTEIP